jgi:hypothetical protein
LSFAAALPLIPAQKIRFWKAIAVLVAACMLYVVYLNVYAFQRVSKPSPDASHLQPKVLKPAAAEQPQQQPQTPRKFRSSESPEMLKAIILKSIPHDTAAFTQVVVQSFNFFLHF